MMAVGVDMTGAGGGMSEEERQARWRGSRLGLFALEGRWKVVGLGQIGVAKGWCDE